MSRPAYHLRALSSLPLSLAFLASHSVADPAPRLSGPATQAALKPSPLPGLVYDAPFFVDAKGAPPAYSPAVPTGDQILGYPIGQRAATHAEIERCFKAWDGKGPGAPDGAGAAQPRARLFEHGKTWEGRTLYHLAISSPANIARLDALKKDFARLSDQRDVSQADADNLAASLPAVAWMAYSIHGDETSGADAALALAYHLVAATDADTQSLLDNLVIVIDPLMNPDGRDRFLKMIAEHRAANPNVDDQSLLHSGYWPYGRTNHYHFDLNRDWIFATQPETRGRINALRQWNPQLFIDAHEMESQDTFLMSPPREPYNLHHPVNRKGWMEKFAAVQAKEFDRYGWRYYTGEWNEGWYPGYSDSWSAFRGSIGMLFEQARMAEDGVRRPEGRIETYRESVHHQAVGSLANLRALRDNKAAVMRDYAKERREAIADGSGATWYAVDGKGSQRLAETLRAQGIEFRQVAPFKASTATDRLGRVVNDKEFEVGTLIIPARQPDRYLAETLLSFDPRFSDEFLRRERRELLRYGHSRLYDTTAWNLPALLDANVWLVEGPTPADLGPAIPVVTADGPAPLPPEADVGWIIRRSDSSSVAARLLERGVRVRVATKDSATCPRGSMLIMRVDNAEVSGGVRETLGAVASEMSVRFTPIESGLGAGNENPDLGSEHFAPLTPPRIAILSRGSLDYNNVGECWFTVDQRLGVRATLLDIDSVTGADLRRYNVLIVPDSWDPSALTEAQGTIAAWVRQGGTLIAIGSSAAALATGPSDDKKESGAPAFGYVDPAGGAGSGSGGPGPLTSVRQLADVLDKLDEYELQVLREWHARHATVDPEPVWSAIVDPTSIHYPWQDAKNKTDDGAEAKPSDAAASDESPAKRDRKWVAGEDAPRPAAPANASAKPEADAPATGADADKSSEPDKPDADEIKRRDEWNRLFMPTGAVLASRIDDRHWLTIGCRTSPENLTDESDETPEARATREAEEAKALASRGGADDYLPVLYTGSTVLMAGPGVEAPIRFGFYLPADDASGADAPASAGWARNPPGQALALRMSGLLWPEAAVRIANSAFVTRDRVGEGQVILFACSPTFRAATLGTSRILENAIVFGPGLGARAPIIP